MPTVSVDKELLFKKIGKSFTDEEFTLLCFEFGIELDGVVEDITYKIDIPANRYDLLCVEGLARALKVFLGLGNAPKYVTHPPKEKIIVESSTTSIRPFCVGAVLRNVTFDEARYKSFIALQDKLHQNICRKRTLVAIGTHDLDTIKGPFHYKALKPESIKFAPLNQTKEMDGKQLMEFYEHDPNLKAYLPIIRNSPVYPIIYSSDNVVLSLPPIINGNHSKITLNTKNVFIECTATDLTKAKIVLDTIVTMFSEYCSVPFSVEQVMVEYQNDPSLNGAHPVFSYRNEVLPISSLYKMVGIEMTSQQVVQCLSKMSLHASVVDKETVSVVVPPTRSDILHPIDIVEDLAIGYGYNRIKRTVPATNTFGKPQKINKITDYLRRELASSGFSEVLTLTLCSLEENFAFLKRTDNKTAVKLSNPKSAEYQVVRTSLIPGLLKSLFSNIKNPLPIRLFEVADVVLKDPGHKLTGVPCRNERRLCALTCSTTSGFELIHGLLDRIMELLDIPLDSEKGYSIEESNSEGCYFPSRSVDVLYKKTKIGSFGIFHPQVLSKFEIQQVCSGIELNIEPLIK